MEEAPSSSSADSLAFSLGIDVGKEALEVALRGDEEAIARTTVANDSEGQDELLRWLQDQGSGPEETSVCMEASGDFEKAIAQRLYEEDYRVSARIRGGSRDTRRASFSARRPTLPTRPLSRASAGGKTRGLGNRLQRRRAGFRSLRELGRP